MDWFHDQYYYAFSHFFFHFIYHLYFLLTMITSSFYHSMNSLKLAAPYWQEYLGLSAGFRSWNSHISNDTFFDEHHLTLYFLQINYFWLIILIFCIFFIEGSDIYPSGISSGWLNYWMIYCLLIWLALSDTKLFYHT